MIRFRIFEAVDGKQLVHHGETTSNFDICPSALKAFRDNQKAGMGDKDGFHEAVVAVDKYLGYEKMLTKKGKADEDNIKHMNQLVDAAKQAISKAGLPGHNYHKVHTDAVKRLAGIKEDMSGMSVSSGHKRPTDKGAGMTKKGVAAYRRRNPGSKLQTAVTTKPSKLKPGSKAAKRRKAFCSRSQSWTSERGKAARRRWNC